VATVSRNFLYLAPDYHTKILLVDADESSAAHVCTLVSGHVDPRFLARAQVGDFVDLDSGKGERLLIRLGEDFVARLAAEDESAARGGVEDPAEHDRDPEAPQDPPQGRGAAGGRSGRG
jgi:hypothetical protein